MDGYTPFEMTPRICPSSRLLFPFRHIFTAHLLPKQFFLFLLETACREGNTVRMQGSIDVKMGPLFRIPQIVWNRPCRTTISVDSHTLWFAPDERRFFILMHFLARPLFGNS
ncbi:hypothetical protein TNCV_1615691 [Trichonephila clavipes]|nr:hypothetical protein TNCV_1615691 [Trichonephila clavipes]